MEKLDSIDEILNPSDESITEENEESAESNNETNDEATGETSQVAAEKADADATPAQIKAELSALAQERARVRQKEAALDEERAKLASATNTDAGRDEQAKDLRSELKDLRKQHRAALLEGVDDDEVEALEEKMEEIRLSIYNQTNQATTAQERAVNEFNAVHSAVHDEFPFLHVDHPDVNPELNEDINAYYHGRVQKGDSQADALRKAVDKFAPAYAKSLDTGINPDVSKASSAEKSRKAEADRLLREKLGKGGFSEVRSVSRLQTAKPFTGITPMEDILKKAS